MNIEMELKEVSSGLNLLIVDDEQESAEVLSRMLGRYFTTIDTSHNGKEALALYKTKKFDLVLTDIDMPKMNGEKLLMELKNIDCLQEVVAMSGSGDTGLVRRLINEGAGGFVAKPMDRAVLMQALLKACNRVQERHLGEVYINQLEDERCIFSSSCTQKTEHLHCTAVPTYTAAQEHFVQEVVTDDVDAFEVVASSGQATQSRHDVDEYGDYFAQLQSDDREELFDIVHDVDSTVVMAFSQGSPSVEYISRLGVGLVKFGSVLLRYQVFSDMGTKIIDLGQTIQSSMENILTKLDESELYISAFCSVLQKYLEDIWSVQSDNPRFYNDSVMNDANSIVESLACVYVTHEDSELMFF